jgi:hypothetical protein
LWLSCQPYLQLRSVWAICHHSNFKFANSYLYGVLLKCFDEWACQRTDLTLFRVKVRNHCLFFKLYSDQGLQYEQWAHDFRKIQTFSVMPYWFHCLNCASYTVVYSCLNCHLQSGIASSSIVVIHQIPDRKNASCDLDLQLF